jgi:hypothetical protein
MYHWSTSDNLTSFDLDKSNAVGGAQFGRAVYLAPTREDADLWKYHFDFRGIQVHLYEVELDANLCSEPGPLTQQWLLDNDCINVEERWLNERGEELLQNEATKARLQDWEVGNCTLQLLMRHAIEALGYDGVIGQTTTGESEAVVWNIASITRVSRVIPS